MRQTKNMLRFRKVFHLVDAKVQPFGPSRELRLLSQVLGNQDLSAPTQGHQTRRAIGGGSEVVPGHFLRMPAVKSHSNAQLADDRPNLALQTVLQIQSALQGRAWA